MPEFVRTARSRTIDRAIFRRNGSIFGVAATPANPPKYRACQQKTKVWHIALHDELLARCYLEKQ